MTNHERDNFSAGLRKHVAPVWYEQEERRDRIEQAAMVVCCCIALGWVLYLIATLAVR